MWALDHIIAWFEYIRLNDWSHSICANKLSAAEEKGMLPQEERERLHFPLADMSLILNYPSCEMSLHQES